MFLVRYLDKYDNDPLCWAPNKQIGHDIIKRFELRHLAQLTTSPSIVTEPEQTFRKTSRSQAEITKGKRDHNKNGEEQASNEKGGCNRK